MSIQHAASDASTRTAFAPTAAPLTAAQIEHERAVLRNVRFELLTFSLLDVVDVALRLGLVHAPAPHRRFGILLQAVARARRRARHVRRAQQRSDNVVLATLSRRR